METKPITPVAAGLVIGLTSVVLFLAYYFTGLIFQQDWTAWLPVVVYAVLVCVFISMWSNANNNFVTYGQCFGFGFKAICIVALISFFFTLAFMYLTPDYKSQMMNVAKEKMRENKQMTDEQLSQGMEMYAKYFTTIALGGGLFFNLLIGTISSLIGAGIAKKKPVSPFSNPNQIGEPES